MRIDSWPGKGIEAFGFFAPQQPDLVNLQVIFFSSLGYFASQRCSTQHKSFICTQLKLPAVSAAAQITSLGLCSLDCKLD